MSTKNEIQAKYLTLHDALGSCKDAEDKELFDQQHAEIWTNCDIELKARKVKLENKTFLTSEQEQELTKLKAMFPTPLPPSPDYLRACELLATSPQVITQPQVWELLRIFGERLGYRR